MNEETIPSTESTTPQPTQPTPVTQVLPAASATPESSVPLNVEGPTVSSPAKAPEEPNQQEKPSDPIPPRVANAVAPNVTDKNNVTPKIPGQTVQGVVTRHAASTQQAHKTYPSRQSYAKHLPHGGQTLQTSVTTRNAAAAASASHKPHHSGPGGHAQGTGPHSQGHNSNTSNQQQYMVRGSRRVRNDKYIEGIFELSAEDYEKIYDKTIMKGSDYQAQIPKVKDGPEEHYSYKIYGYSFDRTYFKDKPLIGKDGMPGSGGYSSYTPMPLAFNKNEEDTLEIKYARRSVSDYLEWDPKHICSDFKVLCFRINQFIKQNYSIDFSDFEILEYYRICHMNKGLFLSTIHHDQSPFLEFVRAKRTKMIRS